MAENILKKIEDLEKYTYNKDNDLTYDEIGGETVPRIGAVLEFGSSVYGPNLFSDGITSAREFMINNVKELTDDNDELILDIFSDDKPLYFANNIHLEGKNINPIGLIVPLYHEYDSSYPSGTTITIEQTTSGGTITVSGEPGVSIDGPTQTHWTNGNNHERILKIVNIGENQWESSFADIGNLLRSVINEEGVITDDYVHGEKGRVLYSDPDRPLHKIVTDTEPGFMGPDDKEKLDSVFLCPLITHVETPEIHRHMIYSEKFKSILYHEEPILPEWEYHPDNPFDTWEEYVEYWGCPSETTPEP